MNNLPNFKEEKELWKAGYRLVIGVDEVGRGAFAGPIVAGAVAFPACHPELVSGSRDSNLRQNDTVTIDDSKRLKPLERKKAAKWIKTNCLAYGIGEVGVRTINKVGIGKATAIAMRKAIGKVVRQLGNQVIGKKYKENPDSLITQLLNNLTKTFVLSDAFHIKYLRGIGLKNQKAIIKGDEKSISIAAASILAKVYRDRLMQKLTKRYRKYRWSRNKGYGTRLHQEEILKNGITPLHRIQFIQTFLQNHVK